MINKQYFDLAIIETLNGGDLQLVGNDLAVVYGVENMPYLSMFGGNIDESTVNQNANQPTSEQNFDWWGNNLLMKNNSSTQFISQTEKTLNNTQLNSAGRVTIENAIASDLQFLATSAKIKVTAVIVATDKININIEIQQSQNNGVIIINFKKAASGDWFLLDFNNDFFL